MSKMPKDRLRDPALQVTTRAHATYFSIFMTYLYVTWPCALTNDADERPRTDEGDITHHKSFVGWERWREEGKREIGWKGMIMIMIGLVGWWRGTAQYSSTG